MNALRAGFFRNRTSGWFAVVTAVLRILCGVAFILAGVAKFADLGTTTAGFVAAGYPDSPVIPFLVALLEVVAGLMLVVGLGTRLAALGLGIVMIGATIANAMTFPAAVPATVLLFVFLAYLLWAGPGKAALDSRILAKQAGTPAHA
jgi:putative oxidoreductase